MHRYGINNDALVRKKLNFLIAVLVIILIFIFTLLVTPEHGGLVKSRLSKKLLIDFINVGNGDCILVRTPMGKSFLIDGGPDLSAETSKKAKLEIVQNYLRAKDINALDGIVVTNWYNNHIGGIINVLAYFGVNQIWECGGKAKTQIYKKYKKMCSIRRIKRITLEAGMTLDWGNELFVQVLHPDGEAKVGDFPGMNDKSVALVLRYGKVQVLLTSNIEKKAQMELLKYGNSIKSQIMQVPFHGSEKSLYKPLLRSVSPKSAVIQVGAGNPFKYPSKNVLAEYKKMGVNMYRTDLNGSVRLIIGGKTSEDFSFEVDR